MGPLSSRPALLEHAFTTHSEEQTEALGAALGQVIDRGHFIGLSGELGAGKTRFVRGVSRGAGVAPSEVASPTFAIVYPYAGRVPLHHADLYRLRDADELYATGFYDLLGGESAVLVEWVDKLPETAPADALLLFIAVPSLDDEGLRHFRARATGPVSAELLKRWIAVV